MPRHALAMTARILTVDHVAVADTIAQHTMRTIDSRWLAHGRAHEHILDIDMAEVRALRQQLHASLAGEGIDINIVPDGAERRKRLLVADMDSTIIEQECIDEIAALAGVGEAVAAITERAMRGEIDFEGALRDRVAALAGTSVDVLAEVLTRRVSITPGARSLVATMTANGATCALVSGGFTFFTQRIADAVGFTVNRANTLEISGGALTGQVVPPILGREAKLQALEYLRDLHGLKPSETLAVGDGANDLAMIRAAGIGVAFRAKPIVAAEADAEITHCDLTGLLYLQGYSSEEIIS